MCSKINSKTFLLVILLIQLYHPFTVMSILRFRNISCESLDPSIVIFEKCEVRHDEDGEDLLSVKTNIEKLPLNKIKGAVDIRVHNNETNSWDLLMSEYKFNICHVFKCPLKENIELENFSPDDVELPNTLKFLRGEFLVNGTLSANRTRAVNFTAQLDLI